MIAPFRFAFGSARVRALKSSLLGPAEGRALASAPSAAAVAALVDPAAAPEARALERRSRARLFAEYAKVASSFAAGRPLFRALLCRHEADVLKTLLRALRLPARGPRTRFGWDLGPLSALAPGRGEDVTRESDLDALVRGTPWAEALETARRAHAGDAAAVELALDRAALDRVVAEARALPRRERGARDLALDVVRERDVDLLARRAVFGLSPEAALAHLSLLGDEEGPSELLAFAAWTPEAGPLHAALPRRLARRAARARDEEELAAALARERLAACRRAFVGFAFRLGPAVALLLLRESESRALGALAESRGRTPAGTGLARALAPSLLGA